MERASLNQKPLGPLYTRKGFRPWWYWLYRTSTAIGLTAFLAIFPMAAIGWPVTWPFIFTATFGIIHFFFQFAVTSQLKSDLLHLQKCDFRICPICSADLPSGDHRSLCPNCQSPFTLPAVRYLWEKSYRAQLGEEVFMKSFRLSSKPRSPGEGVRSAFNDP